MPKKDIKEINDLEFLATLENLDNKKDEPHEPEEPKEPEVKVVEKVPEDYEQLKNVVKEIEPFLPAIEAMKKDEGLYNTVKNYIASGGETPASIREQLGLPEDFVIDMDEVVNNPNSDSAKAFNMMVEKVVAKRIQDYMTKQEQQKEVEERQKQLQKEKEELKKKYNLSDKELEEIDRWASENTWNYDMIFKLYNLEKKNYNVILSQEKEKANQRQNASSFVPPAKGSDSNIPSDDDLLFEQITKAMNPLSKLIKE